MWPLLEESTISMLQLKFLLKSYNYDKKFMIKYKLYVSVEIADSSEICN